MTHHIRHQILELELPREAGAVALQRRASRVFQEQVLPRLDEAFSRIAPEGRHIRLDRLELDLGNIAEANWEREFVEKCVDQIAQQVAEAAFSVGGKNPADTLSAEENALVVFKYFLETGILPWYAKHLTLKELENLVGKAITLENAFLRQELRRVLKEKPNALQRLVWQFSIEFSGKVLASTPGFTEIWVQQVIKIRQSQTGQKISEREFVKLAKHLLNADTSVLKTTPLTPVLVAQMFDTENPTQINPSTTKAQWDSESQSDSHLRPGATDSAELKRPQSSAKEIQTRQKVAQAKSEPEGIPVENAGMVLLAVYLPPFFKKLGLELISKPGEEAQEQHFRAVHLLHFLATGQEHPEEPLLVLPKILCGLSVDTPVPQNLDLSDENKLEANRLLEAVIRNWSVLKNTSPDGLRAGFLRRSGLLSWSEGQQSWVLRVERLGQDLLLERVPWSYSVVKLGWMEEMVSVEW